MGLFIALMIIAVSATVAYILVQNEVRKEQLSARDRIIVQLRLEGLSIREIAQHVDIQKSQVHNICKKYGI